MALEPTDRAAARFGEILEAARAVSSSFERITEANDNLLTTTVEMEQSDEQLAAIAAGDLRADEPLLRGLKGACPPAGRVSGSVTTHAKIARPSEGAHVVIETIGIVGGGQMGAGIAEVAAKAGTSVLVMETDAELVERSLDRVTRSLDRAVERGKLDETARDGALGRVAYTTDLGDFSRCELAIEAVPENETLKADVFRRLDEVMADGSILASNTSSIPITRLGAVTRRPESVIGMHFFNPVPVMGLMELVTTVRTDADVAARAETFAHDVLGKTVIRAQDRGGFVVNMLLVPYLLGAMRMYEAGVATREDIDTGMRLGANHPMGPLELSDFIGLDTMKLVADVLFDEFKEPLYASPPLLTRLVEAGLLGRKTGRGFYDYSR